MGLFSGAYSPSAIFRACARHNSPVGGLTLATWEGDVRALLRACWAQGAHGMSSRWLKEQTYFVLNGAGWAGGRGVCAATQAFLCLPSSWVLQILILPGFVGGRREAGSPLGSNYSGPPSGGGLQHGAMA